MTNTEKTLWRGIEGVVYAPILEDTTEEYTTGEVKYLMPTATLTKSTESEQETHYYDNRAMLTIASAGADEVGIEGAYCPLETIAEITGQMYDAETGTYIEGQRETRYFALGYKTKKANGTWVYVWRYKGTFAIPESTHNTEDDGTDANGTELTFTGIPTIHEFAKGGAVRAINVDVGLDKADVSTFFDTVTTPDMLKAKTY